MNAGFIFIILIAICGATVGMIFVASQANTTATVDTFGRADDQTTNLTRDNTTATMPVGITTMGYGAIVVALIAIVVFVGALIAALKMTNGHGRGYR